MVWVEHVFGLNASIFQQSTKVRPNMPIQVPIILIKNSRIILYAFRYLLVSKFCWHDLSWPNHIPTMMLCSLSVTMLFIAE